MPLLELKNVTKIYKTNDSRIKYALKNFSIMLPSSGLVALVGKSGSGKSTLLNLISLLDNPSEGKIYFNKEDISKWKDKRKTKYHNQDIGMIFQHYQLLEDHSAIYNIMLPSLILGVKESRAKEDAITLLEGINFPKKLYEQKVSNLSGGEKQRVAILRSFINNPKIILADEPTGALDSNNSLAIMDILKNASKKKLVIIVSHNQSLVERYADRIISIKDGKLVSNKHINVEENNGIPLIKEPKRKPNHHWLNKLTKNNFIKRIKRNLISIASLVVGITSSILIISFSKGSPQAINNEGYKQFDYGALTLDKELTSKISSSNVSLVQTLRPTDLELDSLKDKLTRYDIYFNYDSLIPQGSYFSKGDNELKELFYFPISSFISNSFDKTLLVKGELPKEDNLYEVVINQKAYENITKEIGECLSKEITVKFNYQYHFYSNDEASNVITDYFVYEQNIKIVGVVDEISFLSTPKVYYSYIALDDYLSELPMNNLSTYIGYEISWRDMVFLANVNDPIGAYSYRLFIKDISSKEKIKEDIASLPSPFVLSSNAITVSDAMKDLVRAASMGMDLFLIIALIGTSLILGIVSFSSYTEDKKNSAILTCLGASKEDILNIYLSENLVIGLIGLGISFILSPLLIIINNRFLDSFLGIKNILELGNLSIFGVPFLLPLTVLLLTILVITLSTYLPIAFSKKISPKEELKDE